QTAATSSKTSFIPVFNQKPSAADKNEALLFSSSQRMMAATQGSNIFERRMDDFSLLDVSSKANQMGIAFSAENSLLQNAVSTKYKISTGREPEVDFFPVRIKGLDVVTSGRNAQAFTIPQISWEPVLNTAFPEC